MRKPLMILLISLFLSSLAYAYHDNETSTFTKENECLTCHKDKNAIMSSNMALKTKEKAFINEHLNQFDPKFYDKNCNSCHLSSCSDCHDNAKKPSISKCITCHADTFIGADYVGLGIREDHERYQRGVVSNGTSYMKMSPDIHFEKGLTCNDCHSMRSLQGEAKAKQCTDCHKVNREIIDHSIKKHDNLECVSCHASWAALEFGTFYIRLQESENMQEHFSVLKRLSDTYFKSSFNRSNELPPLAISEKAKKFAPIRPMFITFTTEIYKDLLIGKENRMLSNRWKIFTPHTVRREVVLCANCHDNRKRYMLEKDDERVLLPDLDGLPFKSFYNSAGFSLANGEFIDENLFTIISKKDKVYINKYFLKLEQVKKLVLNSKNTLE